MVFKSEKTTASTPFTDYEFVCHYPEENPKETEKDIAQALSYIGVFDDIKKA